MNVQDPDTCAAALDMLHKIIQLDNLRGPVLQISLILLDVYRLTLAIEDPEVLSIAQTVLADGLSHPGMAQEVLSLIPETELLATLSKLEAQCLHSAPSNAQSALHLLGFFLDWTYGTYPAHRDALLSKLATYIRILRVAILDTNPFDARFAAINSIHALHHIWTLPPSSNPHASLLLGLTTVLYDTLNDDDDEIRDVASLATTTLLNAHSKSPLTPTVPILSSHRLATFLTTHFSASPSLAKEGLRRLTDTPFRTPLFSIPFADAFAAASEEDTTLFAAEKQNLFMDPTLDAVFWSRVLSRVDPKCVPRQLRVAINKWVVDGLRAFIETAREKGDGALGWTSKVEVFTLGMRVLCGVGVVVRWEGPFAAMGKKVRRLVKLMVTEGGESGVHGLWVGKGERERERACWYVVRGVAERLRAVEREIEGGEKEGGGKTESKTEEMTEEKKEETTDGKKEEKTGVKTETPDEQSVLRFLAGLSARVRATEGGLMKKAGM